IVSITPEQNTPIPQKALRDKFKDVAGWAEATTRLLRENGFNSAGAWSSNENLRKASAPLAYTVILNWMSGYGKERGGAFQQPGHTGYPNDCIFVFDPGFETYCEKAGEKLKALKDDPYLFGYFSDNEMPFRDDALDKYLSLPESDAGYQAAMKWLREHKGANAGKADIKKEDRDKFLNHMAERYFKVVATAIKKADPNHIYLGPRFNGRVLKQRPVFEAAGPYLDVVSVNYYNAWTPDPALMKDWGEWAGKPFMVTEWYTKGEDSGMANTTGAGWIVKTQKDRGLFYQNYVLGLLEAKDCIGWQWFKYQDNDPNNLKTDPSNRDSNKGIVNVEFKPYTPLLEQMKEINERAYTLTEYFDKRP
ncbi:MAG: hypothetical protein NTX50_28860, partial [Candidatus Sumerlaeota bacterium]|nr:hypothetical protein [Candidatus Sumerlaeota bacterium]